VAESSPLAGGPSWPNPVVRTRARLIERSFSVPVALTCPSPTMAVRPVTVEPRRDSGSWNPFVHPAARTVASSVQLVPYCAVASVQAPTLTLPSSRGAPLNPENSNHTPIGTGGMTSNNPTLHHANDRRLPAAGLIAFITRAYRDVGLSEDDAASAAHLMAEADLVGADAHGIFRLPQYIERIEAGGINRRPDIATTRTAPATARVDGDNGLGHLVVSRAAETAIAMARETGVAWVGIRGSNHSGVASV